MQIHNGNAENVQHSSDIQNQGSGSNIRQKTIHIVQFNIEGHSISYQSPKPLHLTNGDNLTVALGSKILGLKVKGIHNHTKNSSTIKPLTQWFAFGFLTVLIILFELFLGQDITQTDIFKGYTLITFIRIAYLIVLVFSFISSVGTTKLNKKLETRANK